MEHIGYSLVHKETKKEIEFWGDVPGQSSPIPNLIILPNGDNVLGPSLDTDYSGYIVVPRYFIESNKESISYSNNTVIVKRSTISDTNPTIEELQAQLADIAAKIAKLSTSSS